MLLKLVVIEIYSLLRQKRLRTYVALSVVFMILCTFAVIDTAGRQKRVLMILWIAAGTTYFFVSTGFLIFNKDCNYFAFYRVTNVSLKQYVAAKALVLQIGGIITGILPFAFFAWLPRLAKWLFGATLAYNLGITTYLVLYLSTFSIQKVDLSRSAFLNYEGIPLGRQLLVMPPFLFLSIIPDFKHWGIICLFIAGFLGMLMTKKWVLALSKVLLHKKYEAFTAFGG